MKHVSKIYKNFLTVKELDKELIALVGKEAISIIGKSKNKHPILCGTIGHGKKNALLFGFPHPNEPVGSLTCLEWIKLVQASEELQNTYTWHIVPCADPDGAKLNEGWFKGKFSIKKYVDNFYRQISDQTDWSFPMRYKDYTFNKPTKQTKALMNLIEKTKPSLVYSLHNSSFSGAYFLQTKSINSSHFRAVEKACKQLDIPLHKGKPEVPFAKELHPSFYQLFGNKEEYEFLKKIKQNPLTSLIGGASSAEYAKQINKKSFSLVCEIPYLYDSALSNTKKTGTTKKEALTLQLDDNESVYNFLRERIVHKGINKQSNFYRVNKENIKILKGMVGSQKAMIENIPNGKVTVAELFSSRVINKFYRTLFLGEFKRLLLDSKKTKQRESLLTQTNTLIKKRIRFINKHSNYRSIPIKNLIELQIVYLQETIKNHA
jgi:hypothetical protein